jgi:hypothetical protein
MAGFATDKWLPEVGTVGVFLKPNRIQPTNFETEPNRTDLIF